MALAHITLATRDVAKSVTFFRDALGWQPVARPGNIGMTAAWLEIAPGTELHLIEDLAFEPSPFEQRVRPTYRRLLPARRFPPVEATIASSRGGAHRAAA